MGGQQDSKMHGNCSEDKCRAHAQALQQHARRTRPRACAGAAAPPCACIRHLMSSVGQARKETATPAPSPATAWSPTVSSDPARRRLM